MAYTYTPTYPILPPDRDIKEGLISTPLRTLSTPQETGATEESGHIKPEHVKYVGSYSWVDEETPTIIVPGSPPVWRERTLPYHVAFDQGVLVINHNELRMGSTSTLLALFRAVDVVAEINEDTSLDWSTIDIVTDRNGLRKLMRWLRYSSAPWGETPKEFRIDLQLGGNKTVLMHGWGKRTIEIATPPRTGCGHNFELESTTPAKGCERGTAHHRIVQYELGGLKLVVRFEVDACTASLAAPVTLGPNRTAGPTRPTSDALVPSVDSLTHGVSGLGVSSATTSSESPAISVIRAGSQVPHAAVVELKTRSAKFAGQFDWAEEYPQLLLSYTPNLFLGVHRRGYFEHVERYTLGSAEMRHVEANTKIQRSFRGLVSILRTIQALVKEHGERGKLSLVCQNGVLKVYERTSDARCLSDEELTRFRV